LSEIFANSIRHSGSGAPGETVTVAVKTADDVLRVEVTDLSGPGVPQPRHSGSEAEDGRGLHLVTRLAARWGWRRRGGRTVTWFELQALLRQMQHSAVSGKGLNSPDEGAPGVRRGSSRALRSGSGLLDGVPALRDFADAPFDSPLLATIL
jgi:hypothetical protein